MKESFVFFRSFFEAIEEIDEKKQLKLYKSIANFALNNEKPTDLKGIEKAIFSLIEPQITASSKRYEVSKKCGEYGKLGGRPKKEKTLKGFENETLNVNVNDNDNDNENVNVNVNGETKKTDPYINPIKSFFISEYQKVFNTKPYLSNSDCIRLTELSSEYPEIREIIPTAISRLKKISFDDINFKPTASWLLRSNNFERVMNGEFDTSQENDWMDDWVKGA
jgi:hypothetical protein